MTQVFVWTLDDIIGLIVLGIAGVWVLGLYVLYKWQRWQYKRRNR